MAGARNADVPMSTSYVPEVRLRRRMERSRSGREMRKAGVGEGEGAPLRERVAEGVGSRMSVRVREPDARREIVTTRLSIGREGRRSTSGVGEGVGEAAAAAAPAPPWSERERDAKRLFHATRADERSETRCTSVDAAPLRWLSPSGPPSAPPPVRRR
jgi:hypothetical protein